LAFPEFGYVLKRDRARVLAVGRQARLAARGAYVAAAYDSDDDGDNGVDFGVGGGYGGAGDDDGDDDDDGGGGNYGAGDDDGGGFGPDPNALLASQLSPGGFDGEYDDGGGEDGFSVAPLALDEAFAKGPKSYAELCRAHIASFSRGADRYAHESHLSRRVSEWQEKLGPVLEEQNARRPFDIHAYGGEVLSAAAAECVAAKQRNAALLKGAKGKLLVSALSAARAEEREDEAQVSFGVVGRGRPTYDVCRLFLAALQLSNNGNVVLHHPVGIVCGPETFKLEVLSTVTSQDRFDNYLAPSLSH
jgi:condensin-2 complex subunit H2